jgi:hypothetical protein
MPEVIRCPQCDKPLSLPDKFLGKKVKCPGCATMFVAEAPKPQTVPAKSAPPPPPVPKRAAPKEEEPRGRKRSLMDEVDDAPLESRGAKRPTRKDDYDDDEEEDRPRPRSRSRDDEDDDRRSRVRRREDDDRGSRARSSRYDDEDDDDRPRSRRSRDDDYDDEDDYEDRRSKSRGADTKSAWQGVRAGLNLWVYGAWSFLISVGGLIVIMLLLFLIMMAAQNATVLLIMAGVYLLFALGMFICGIVMVVGQGMCMQAPNAPDHPTRTLAISSFCCFMAPLVLSIGFVGLGLVARELGSVLSLGNLFLNPALGLASLILFCLFLRSVAYQARNRDLAERCMRWMVTYLITLGSSFVLFFVLIILTVLLAVGGARGGGAQGAFIASGIMGIFLFVFYIGLGIWMLVLFIQLIGLVSEVRDTAGRLSNKKKR